VSESSWKEGVDDKRELKNKPEPWKMGFFISLTSILSNSMLSKVNTLKNGSLSSFHAAKELSRDMYGELESAVMCISDWSEEVRLAFAHTLSTPQLNFGRQPIVDHTIWNNPRLILGRA
jgi:hypothetical protein